MEEDDINPYEYNCMRLSKIARSRSGAEICDILRENRQLCASVFPQHAEVSLLGTFRANESLLWNTISGDNAYCADKAIASFIASNYLSIADLQFLDVFLLYSEGISPLALREAIEQCCGTSASLQSAVFVRYVMTVGAWHIYSWGPLIVLSKNLPTEAHVDYCSYPSSAVFVALISLSAGSIFWESPDRPMVALTDDIIFRATSCLGSVPPTVELSDMAFQPVCKNQDPTAPSTDGVMASTAASETNCGRDYGVVTAVHAECGCCDVVTSTGVLSGVPYEIILNSEDIAVESTVIADAFLIDHCTKQDFLPTTQFLNSKPRRPKCVKVIHCRMPESVPSVTFFLKESSSPCDPLFFTALLYRIDEAIFITLTYPTFSCDMFSTVPSMKAIGPFGVVSHKSSLALSRTQQRLEESMFFRRFSVSTLSRSAWVMDASFYGVLGDDRSYIYCMLGTPLSDDRIDFQLLQHHFGSETCSALVAGIMPIRLAIDSDRITSSAPVYTLPPSKGYPVRFHLALNGSSVLVTRPSLVLDITDKNILCAAIQSDAHTTLHILPTSMGKEILSYRFSDLSVKETIHGYTSEGSPSRRSSLSFSKEVAHHTQSIASEIEAMLPDASNLEVHASQLIVDSLFSGSHVSLHSIAENGIGGVCSVKAVIAHLRQIEVPLGASRLEDFSPAALCGDMSGRHYACTELESLHSMPLYNHFMDSALQACHMSSTYTFCSPMKNHTPLLDLFPSSSLPVGDLLHVQPGKSLFTREVESGSMSPDVAPPYNAPVGGVGTIFPAQQRFLPMTISDHYSLPDPASSSSTNFGISVDTDMHSLPCNPLAPDQPSENYSQPLSHKIVHRSRLSEYNSIPSQDNLHTLSNQGSVSPFVADAADRPGPSVFNTTPVDVFAPMFLPQAVPLSDFNPSMMGFAQNGSLDHQESFLTNAFTMSGSLSARQSFTHRGRLYEPASFSEVSQTASAFCDSKTPTTVPRMGASGSPSLLFTARFPSRRVTGYVRYHFPSYGVAVISFSNGKWLDTTRHSLAIWIVPDILRQYYVRIEGSVVRIAKEQAPNPQKGLTTIFFARARVQCNVMPLAPGSGLFSATNVAMLDYRDPMAGATIDVAKRPTMEAIVYWQETKVERTSTSYGFVRMSTGHERHFFLNSTQPYLGYLVRVALNPPGNKVHPNSCELEAPLQAPPLSRRRLLGRILRIFSDSDIPLSTRQYLSQSFRIVEPRAKTAGIPQPKSPVKQQYTFSSAPSVGARQSSDNADSSKNRLKDTERSRLFSALVAIEPGQNCSVDVCFSRQFLPLAMISQLREGSLVYLSIKDTAYHRVVDQTDSLFTTPCSLINELLQRSSLGLGSIGSTAMCDVFEKEFPSPGAEDECNSRKVSCWGAENVALVNQEITGRYHKMNGRRCSGIIADDVFFDRYGSELYQCRSDFLYVPRAILTAKKPLLVEGKVYRFHPYFVFNEAKGAFSAEASSLKSPSINIMHRSLRGRIYSLTSEEEKFCLYVIKPELAFAPMFRRHSPSQLLDESVGESLQPETQAYLIQSEVLGPFLSDALALIPPGNKSTSTEQYIRREILSGGILIHIQSVSLVLFLVSELSCKAFKPSGHDNMGMCWCRSVDRLGITAEQVAAACAQMTSDEQELINREPENSTLYF